MIIFYKIKTTPKDSYFLGSAQIIIKWNNIHLSIWTWKYNSFLM